MADDFFDVRLALQAERAKNVRNVNEPKDSEPASEDPDVNRDVEDEVEVEEQPKRSEQAEPFEFDASDESDMTVSTEITPAGTAMSMTDITPEEAEDLDLSTAKRPNKPKPVKNAPEKVNTVHIRDIPRTLVSRIRSCPGLDDAKNNTDAVAAFMAVHLDERSCLTDEQTRLADAYSQALNKQDSMASIMKKLDRALVQVSQVLSLSKEGELALSWLLFDRFGYRKDNPARPSDVDLLEPGVDDLAKRLQEQSKQRDNLERRRNGRPFK